MLDLSSTFKLLTCFNLQCEFFSHYYMMFCFSNYQNYSLVLFYFTVMFKWAFPFNQCNLSFTWGMRIIIMANTHACMNYPIEIWHIMELWSLGFLFLFGSLIYRQNFHSWRESVHDWSQPLWEDHSDQWKEPLLMNLRLRLAWYLGDWKNKPNPLWVGLERVVIWWEQL